jgi:hypothetical protein
VTATTIRGSIDFLNLLSNVAPVVDTHGVPHQQYATNDYLNHFPRRKKELLFEWVCFSQISLRLCHRYRLMRYAENCWLVAEDELIG